ncbi:MAG: gliding motility-associated C-terminal domain-containing protein [Cyclobacteriaceae bacterium]
MLIDSASGCTSIEANVQLIDVPTIPELDQNVTPNTICDPGLAASGNYDGEVEIITTDATNVTDYSYVWYDGTGTGTPTAYTATNNILSEAPDGNYTVVATSNLTGCDTTIYATIGDATTIPTIDNVTTQNVTACEGGPAYPNGSITVAAVTGTGPYDYLYYYGTDAATGTLLSDGIDIFTQTGTPGAASVNVNGNGTATITGLSAGDYTIVLIDQASGCSSIEANVALSNVPTIPALDQNITPNTVCDIATNNSGTYDGEVEIITTDATNVTDYTYVWYDGTGTGTPTTYTATNNILSEAPDGNYTVVATSNLTGCDTTIYATIGDATVDPVLGTFNITDMTVCDGAAVYPNGAIEVDEPSITGSGDYSYEFYWGPSVDAAKRLSDGDNITFEKTGFASGVNIDITANVISNLDTGFYTIVAIDNVSGCISGEQTVEIEDVFIAINVPAPAISHYTNCDAPDGSITISPSMASGPEPALGYSYQWYYGSGTGNTLDAADLTDGTALAGTTTATVSGLEDGTYTVLITNNDTGCDTEEEYDIQDQRVYPVVDPSLIATTPNVNCSGAPTGTIDPTAAVSEPGPYVFTLYDAADVVITTEDTGGGDDGIFDGLAAANYKIGVELASGCVSVATASVTVSDNLTKPSINHSLTPETSCISPNGQITVSSPGGVTPTGGWTINVYQGSGSGGALQENIGTGVTGGFPLSTVANLDNGLYTIQVINNQTGCDSLREVTIVETLDRPTGIAATKTDNTFCTSDNGQVTITSITNGGATPIYNIYAGSTVTGTPDSTSTDNVFENLPAGPYTVTVTKAESGCESTGVTRTVNNTPITVTGTVSLISDQTSCDLSDPNGQLTANPTSQSADPNDFTFEWFQGQNTNPANAIPASAVTGATLSGTNNRTVTGLPAGTYRVKITNTESGCFTTVDRTIIISTVNPSVAAAPTTQPNTSCTTPDGEISITIQDNSAAINDGAAGYTFELFVGTTINPSSVPIQTVNNGTPAPTTETFTGLLDGDYIIRATDNNTDCKVVSVPINVGYNGITATFDESLFFKQAISACFDEDGIIDVSTGTTLGGVHSGPIHINWYAGTDTTNAANQLSNLHNVVALTYPVDFQDVVVSGVTIQNGRIGDGDFTTTGGLPAISYTGVVTLSNGCQEIINTNLTLGSAPDVVTSVSIPVTRCDPAFDGEIEITMDVQPGNNPAEYNWYIFEGSQQILPDADGNTPFIPNLASYGPIADQGSFTDITDGAIETVTATGLSAGLYTIGIEFDADDCITHVSTITIDDPEYPELTLDYVLNNNVCDASGGLSFNGAIVVDAIHNTLGGTFDFTWYYDNDGGGFNLSGTDQTLISNGANGAGAGSNVTGATTTNNNTAGISGIGPGWYRVIAIHNNNNVDPPGTDCPDTLDIQVFDETVDVTATAGVDYTFNDMDDCNGFGDFTLTQVNQTIGGSTTVNATVAADYTITWTKDGGAFAPDSEVNDADLLPGDYSLELVQDTTGCSTTIDFTIEDLTVDPIIELVLITNNTTCSGGANPPTGSIEVQIVDDNGTPLAVAGEYAIEWYENAGLTIDLGTTVGLEAGADNEFATQLPAGTYYVEVTDINAANQNDACVASAMYNVIDDPADVSIQTQIGTDYTITHQTNCTPGENGAVSILNVYEDGVADPVANGNYLFNWYDADQVTPISVGAVGGAFNEDVTNLPAGTYYAEAENQTTDCISDKVPFTINDSRVIPNLQLAQTLPDTTCVGSLAPSGKVTASVILPGGGSGNPADYTFTWYEGVGTGTPITVGAVDGAAVNGEMYEQLPAGIYTVEVEDNVTPGDNCTATAQITVSRFTPVISIQTVDITIQNDLECNIDNGSATVDAVTVTKYGGGTYKVNSGDAAFADFDFNWYAAASGGPSLDNDNVYDMQPAGTYYVSVSNNQTMCAMPAGGRKAVTIQDETTLPNVQLVTKTPDEYCTTVADEGDGTLEIEIIHEGNNPANPADYNITWYRGTGTGTTLAAAPGSSAIAGGGTQLTGLSTGTYTVVVAKNGTPNDGCNTQKTFTIVRDVPTYALPLSATTLQDNLNCSNPNGSITIDGVNIDGVFEDFGTTLDNYTINWPSLPGGSTLTTTGDMPNDLVTNLPGGTYQVNISNDRTGCSISANITIDDDTSNPLIQLVAKSADTYCATVTPFEGDGWLNIKLVHEGGNPADSTLYNFEWFRGTGTGTTLISTAGSSVESPNGTGLTGLSAGTYTVRVTDANTPNLGCLTTQTFTINRDAPTYSLPLSAMTIQDNQNCVNPNGTITINGIHIDGVFEDFSTTGDTYTIAWTGLPGTAVVNTVNFANDEVTALEAGLYEVDITNDRTGCTVNATIELDDIGTTPVVQLVSKNPDEYCATLVPNEGDGDLTIKVVHEGNNPADPLDYAVTWYRGTGTATTLASALGTASVSADGTNLTGLSTGTYTVTVSKNGTPNDGCLVQQTFTINRDPQTYSLPEAAITKTNNFNCSTPNGTITIDGVFIDGVFDDFSATADTYVLNWTGLPGGAVLNTVNFADDQVTTIPGGTYTVDVTNERTNCTVTASITITDVTSNPLVQLVTKTPDEYCATVTPNEGDGTLNIKLVHEGNNPADSTLYNFEWFRGTGTGTALAGGALGSATISPNGTVLTGLSAGTYTVRVTDANTPNLGCVTTQTFTINRDAPTYSLPLSAMTIQDNLNCSNPNGSITIDGVRIDGVFEDFSTTGDTYTINWTGLPGTATLNTVNFANDQVTGIEGGTYTVDVLNDRTGCTVSADVVLDDVTSNPLVQLVIKQPDEYCDNTGFQGNGSLELRIVHEGNNPANPTDYNITWYRGNGTGTTLASAPGSSVLAGSGTQLSGLSSGIYTVVVTKNGTPNDQCLTTTTFSIEKDIPLFSIQTSSVVIAHNTNCTNPNGSIQLSNVVVDGVVRDLATFGADYAFTWPDGYNGGTPGSINSPNDIATGLPAGTYKIIGENVATGCATDTINVIILDDPTEPALSFTVDAINTNCGPTKNGQLTVTATTADGNPNTGVGRYTFTWYDGQGTATGTSYVQSDGVGANDNQSTLLALDSGYYTVTVFDNINECSITGTYAVSETKDVPKVLLSDIVVRADTTCNVGSSGTIIVADSSFATGVLDDFDVEIRSGTSTGPIVAQSTAGSGNTDLTVSSLDPGTFYVTATRAATECPAAPVKIIILDERFPPAIQLDTMVANPNCGGTIALGSIAVTANGFDETNPDYIFQWYVGTIGGGVIVPGANGGNTATMINVAEGQYELSVTNVNTGCVATQLFDLPATPVNPRISSYEVSNNLICNVPGDGSFEVNQIRWNGNFFDAGVTADSLNMVTNYTFEYYSDAALTTPVADLDLSTPLQLDGLSAGTYYARVRRNDSQCASGPIQFTIQDIPQYPVIQLTQLVADSTCNGMNPNGTISALVDGVANDTLYTYDWFEVDPVSGARISGSLSNNDTINGLAAGRYEVEVTGVSTGCVSTAQRTVINAPIDVRILSMSGIDPTSCDPPNGIIEVVSITPGVLSDYTFTFYLGDPGNGGVQVQTALGPAFASASSGTYYVEAMHNVYGCTNNLNEIVLEDNLTYPDIDLISFNNQTNCDPGNPNGEISAMADGSTDNTAYTFEWRDASNTVVEPNNATVSNIPAGTFTLNVTDNSTGCMSSAMFDIIDDYPDPIRLVISTSSNTNCTNPNGEVSATIRNLQALGKPITDYLFYWFNGDQTAGVPDIANPDYTGTLITDLPDGDYTVYVVDASDAFCTSEPTLVTIQDRTLPPPFQVEIQNHVTICYDSLPNGRAKINPASLEASRELFEFRYEWYVGTAADTAGQVPFVTGIRADSLDVGSYSVLSTDLRTGCQNLVTFDIIDDTDDVPAPDVNVVSDRDNCMFANGHAVASISGTIAGYRFEWFLASGDTTTVQFTGHEVFTLDSVDYKVRATRLSTGCISPRTPVEIINAIEDPVFEIATTTSLCLRTEDGAFNQFTGTAEVIFSQFGVIKQIDWIAPDGTVFSNDIKLVNAQPGTWEVRFVLDNDCEYFGSFGIQTALKIYNGVSANADGLNDYFFIDCIDYFPNNNVQIFNRDGTKVWESDSYNNNDIRFDGFSNVGRGGLQLPAGTYFYIIEKGPQELGTDDDLEDNTIRPRIQGYLELVR